VLITFDDRELEASLRNRAPTRKSGARFPSEKLPKPRRSGSGESEYDQRRNGYRQEDIDARKPISTAHRGRDTHAPRFSALRRTCRERPRLQAAARYCRSQLEDGTGQKDNAQQKLDELKRGYRPEELQPRKPTIIRRRPHSKNSSAATGAKTLPPRAQSSLTMKRVSASGRFSPLCRLGRSTGRSPGRSDCPNTPIATLLERDQIYVRIYIRKPRWPRATRPESRDPRGFLSQPVFCGVVEQINQQAEFCRAMCRR